MESKTVICEDVFLYLIQIEFHKFTCFFLLFRKGTPTFSFVFVNILKL